jgi:predicted TIM-barrel fold metal-dependent hydrolase
LAKVLNAITRDGSNLHPDSVSAMLGLADGTSIESDPEATIRAMALATPRELRFEPDVAEGIAAAATVEVGAMTPAAEGFALDGNAPARDFTTLLSRLNDVDVTGLFDTVGDFIRWVGFLTHDEQSIMRQLFETYPVDLYVHHMMDMQHYYSPGKCYYKFNADQINRMRKLVEIGEGRLLTFVAWSPKRRNDVELVRETVTNGGAIGVKVYPPSGYQANEAMNDALWALCLERHIPVFTHCTSQGFEAKAGFGVKSDPQFWRRVLERPHHDALRLCFGHAGGEDGWFAETEEDWNNSFAKQVFDLCVRYPNVYCETGYMDQILRPEARARFIARLVRCIREAPAFASKIMYGTDWHMIERLDGHRDYFAAFEQAFAADGLREHAKLFFYANAVAYLNLRGFTERHAGSTAFDVSKVEPHLSRVAAKADAMRQENRFERQ